MTTPRTRIPFAAGGEFWIVGDPDPLTETVTELLAGHGFNPKPFGWFGPLTVRPELWNRGIARALLDATMERFAARRTTTEALYTFASSPKHLALYQRYGFWPRRLTATLARARQRRRHDAGAAVEHAQEERELPLAALLVLATVEMATQRWTAASA